MGDLAGIIQRLDYVSQTLGVDAIWLSPFYPSPMADFGYDVSNYTGVDPLFGDLAAFDRLVAEAHRTPPPIGKRNAYQARSKERGVALILTVCGILVDEVITSGSASK